jgi:hypothetical protein
MKLWYIERSTRKVGQPFEVERFYGLGENGQDALRRVKASHMEWMPVPKSIVEDVWRVSAEADPEGLVQLPSLRRSSADQALRGHDEAHMVAEEKG